MYPVQNNGVSRIMSPNASSEWASYVRTFQASSARCEAAWNFSKVRSVIATA